MAAEHLRLLERIRLYEADNGRPHGESWPELDAALHEMNTDWDDALSKIMRMEGAPVSSNRLFRLMARFQFVDEPIDLQKVRVRLAQGKKRGLWRRVKRPRQLSGWVIDEQQASSTAEETPEARPEADHPSR